MDKSSLLLLKYCTQFAPLQQLARWEDVIDPQLLLVDGFQLFFNYLVQLLWHCPEWDMLHVSKIS
jgi:hypothetical protein